MTGVMPFQPGDRFGRYELMKLLGKGGMGEVYRAQDTVLHRLVALKVLAAGTWGTGPNQTDGAARILREARAAAGVSHANAVAIYDVGEVDGVAFLAMELVVGQTLRTFVGDPSIALPRKLRWLADVARALGAAHRLGVIHRDIKPENIMVREDGVVKVLDFGIARRAKVVDPAAPTEGASTPGTLSTEGIVVGTPMYMAPEQMRGEPLDGRADQFAWGVLAYELLAGRLPWDVSEGQLQLLSQILSKDVDGPRAVNPEIPVQVDAAIRVAMSKAAKNRFPTMDELADEVEPFASSTAATSQRVRERVSFRAPEQMAFLPTEASLSSRNLPVANAPSTRTSMAATDPASSPTKTRGRRLLLFAATAIVALGFGVRLAGGPHSSTAHQAQGAGDAAPAEEPALSRNPEAAEAYRAGLRALRDASINFADSHFKRAIELDPAFGAAHLQRAIIESIYDQGVAGLREELGKAHDLRASLGEHGRTLLDAMEPWVFEPPDMNESFRRFDAAVRAHPSDLEFAFCRGLVLEESVRIPEAAAQFGELVARDPAFALAWRMRGRALVLMDDIPGGRAAYDECLKLSPSARACLTDIALLQQTEGKCGELEATSRQLIAVSPWHEGSYYFLADALAGQGQPLEAIRAVLEQKRNHLPEAERADALLTDEAALALITGDFAGADRRYADLEHTRSTDPDDASHFDRIYARILIALETGRNADALKLADAYLRRRAAWTSNPLQLDPAIHVYVAQLAAGGLERSAYTALRDQWLDRETKRSKALGRGEYLGVRWIRAFALAADDKEAALAALAVKPDTHPLVGALWMSPAFAEPLGRTYALAGKLDDAVPVLTAASHACTSLDFVDAFMAARAAFDLGTALEARGDTAGACDAYGRILAQWGAASPRSITADRALKRARAIGCDRATGGHRKG